MPSCSTVVTINARTLRISEGSWFRGKLYPMRCDVSFDGKFMVYLAMGASGKTWNGVCRLPWLTTFIDDLRACTPSFSLDVDGFDPPSAEGAAPDSPPKASEGRC